MARPAPVDPLADLRAPEPEAASLPPSEAPQPPEKATAPADFLEAAPPRIVAAWHEDTTAAGILHRGGTCGCHYLARLSLRTTVAEQVEAEPEEEADSA